MNRIVGLETEYGCLTNDPSGPPSAVGRVRNWVFEKNRFGLADMHQRDWDEPAGNGGFLFNGGRAYVDMGHLEYCTPECLSLIDLLRYDRAGDAILLQALKEMQQKLMMESPLREYQGLPPNIGSMYTLPTRRPFLRLTVFLRRWRRTSPRHSTHPTRTFTSFHNGCRQICSVYSQTALA